MQPWLPYLLVGLGSFVGGNARYLVTRWVGVAEGRLPLATLLINVAGSFLLGVLAGVLAQRPTPHGDALRLALGVGFCGGFTTFSAFAYENSVLLEDGRWLMAAAYAALSLFLGLAAVRAGLLTARWV
jgi:fluoride exporter